MTFMTICELRSLNYDSVHLVQRMLTTEAKPHIYDALQKYSDLDPILNL